MIDKPGDLSTRGAFRYQGGQSWKYIGSDERLLSFTVYRQSLYALVNGGPAHRGRAGHDLTNGRPQTIGSDAHAAFDGAMSDLRLCDRALTPNEVAPLA